MQEIRPCAGDADKELALAIYNETLPAVAVSMDEVRRWESEQTAVADYVAFLDGTAAGSATVGIAPARPTTAQTFLAVIPRFRRRGVGSALYVEISAWAREHDVTELTTRVDGEDPESVRFAERRDFTVTAHETRFVLDLVNLAPPPADPPPGIEIVRWAERPELARGIHEVALEAHPDVPGSEDWTGEPFDVWERGRRPSLTFVAVEGGEVVGFAELFVTAARPEIAGHMMTGVKRAWRGRGIAGALKRAQIAWAKEHGFKLLQTWNERRNEPIRRLNEKLGYEVRGVQLKMRGPLA